MAVDGRSHRGQRQRGDRRLWAPVGNALHRFLLDHLHTAGVEGDPEIRIQRGVHIGPKAAQEEIRIDEFQRGVGGGQRVAEIRRPAESPVLERADEPEVGVFVEKRQRGEPRVLENGDERLARRRFEHLVEPHDGDQRRAQRVGDDREILLFTSGAQRGDDRRILFRNGDGRADHLAASGWIGNHPPGGLVHLDGGVCQNRRRIQQRRIPQIRERGGIVELRLQLGGGELIGDVQDHPQGGRALRARVAQRLAGDGLQPGGVLQRLLGERGTVAPLGFLAVVIESGDACPIHADVELEVQLKRFLIPRGVGSAGGAAQNGACLPELFEDVQGCRMLKRGQGTEW